MANPNAHIHVQFLTQMTVLVGNLGFQSMTDQYKTPCMYLLLTIIITGGRHFVDNTGNISWTNDMTFRGQYW